MKVKFIYENINFERGQDPKSSIGIGHAKLYPSKTLFKRIYKYWEKVPETGWPKEFEELTPIIWSIKEPKFNVILKINNKLEENSYTFYLTEDGVVMFYDHYIDTNEGQRKYKEKEYYIEDFIHFIRILQSNHTQIINVKESLDFERGKDPRQAMDLGFLYPIKKQVEKLNQETIDRGFFKIPMKKNPYATEDKEFTNLISWGDNNNNYLLLYILNSVADQVKRKFRVIGGHWDKSFKAVDDDYPPRSEDGSIHGWIDFRDSGSYYNPWNRAFGLWESQNFERGMDPLEKMNIGSKDAKILNKIRPFVERAGWEETEISLPVEGKEIETLMQWDHPMGNQALLYKLPNYGEIFYEIQIIIKGMYDQDEKYYLESQFLEHDFWDEASELLFK